MSSPSSSNRQRSCSPVSEHRSRSGRCAPRSSCSFQCSVQTAEPGMDGISCLIAASACGIQKTPLDGSVLRMRFCERRRPPKQCVDQHPENRRTAESRWSRLSGGGDHSSVSRSGDQMRSASALRIPRDSFSIRSNRPATLIHALPSPHEISVIASSQH
jgi:hypothetical protein